MGEEQKLPRTENSLPGKSNGELTQNVTYPGASTGSGTDLGKTSPVSSGAEGAGEAGLELARSTDAVPAVIDRWLTTQVRLLRPRGGEAMTLVATAGGHTQIRVQIRVVGNRAEAKACVERGDFERLNLHWPDLQAHLARQGVHVGPLESRVGAGSGPTVDHGSHSSGWSGGGHSPRREPEPDEPVHADDWWPTGWKTKGEPALQAARRRRDSLLETWA